MSRQFVHPQDEIRKLLKIERSRCLPEVLPTIDARIRELHIALHPEKTAPEPYTEDGIRKEIERAETDVACGISELPAAWAN
jgi:hypothetical protein